MFAAARLCRRGKATSASIVRARPPVVSRASPKLAEINDVEFGLVLDENGNTTAFLVVVNEKLAYFLNSATDV